MPQDPDPRNERDRSARDLLSDEELRELLSPFEGMTEEDGDPVLLLTAHPEDVEPITSHLRHYGIRVVPASHCDTALDLFRQGFVHQGRIVRARACACQRHRPSRGLPVQR